MTRSAQHDAERLDHPPTIPAALARAAQRWPTADALVAGDRRLTFAGLSSEAEQVARGLIARNVRPGDRVVIWAPNSTEFVIGAMGAYCAGAVVVPLNTRLTPHEGEQLIRRAGARVVFAFEEFLGRHYLESLRESGLLADLDLPVSLRGTAREGCLTLEQVKERGALVDATAATARAAGVRADTISDIMFTSGTTGAPKGVMLRHEASCRAYTEYGRSLGLQPGDRMIGLAPFFHCFGLKGLILTGILHGAAVLPMATFDAAELAELIAREHATVLQGAPPIFRALLDDPRVDRAALTSLRVAAPGAMGSSTQLYHRLRDELGFRAFAPGYGLTEATAIAARCYWFDDFETVSTTSGRPAPGISLRIIDEHGAEAPADVDGEILVKGYTVMAGYFENPAATADTIRDGWLHTGDIGHLDDLGRVTVTDRKKDMFLVGGFNTYPAEIEQALAEFPGVAAVAVVGVPDPRLGEVGKAYLVPVDPQALEVSELEAFARRRLANYKVPRYWEVVPDLPRNASGKVQKFLLREQVQLSEASEPETSRP